MQSSYIALSLHEDYAPSWKVWEGVRELIQNCHDGALSDQTAGRLLWTATAQDNSFRCMVEGCGEALAIVRYLPEEQRLVMVNRDTSLHRRILLLGSSQKETSLAIGQFGEGLKVGTLALLREGRRVDMRTHGERWSWCRRVDEKFGVRVLTVAVTPAGADSDSCVDDGSPFPETGDRPTRPQDTETLVEPIHPDEWVAFSERFLFLSPPSESFEAAELGSLLLDERHRGQLYVKGIWIADLAAEHGLTSGLNLKHLRLDRDRRAVVHASDLENQAAALWVRAIDARPELAPRLYALLEADPPGADVRKVASFLNAKEKPHVMKALLEEFFAAHGPDAVPIAASASSSTVADLGNTLSALDDQLRKRIVVVSSTLLDVLRLAPPNALDSLDELRRQAAAKEGAAVSAAVPVPWTELDEESRVVARRVTELMRAAGDARFEVGLLDVFDYGDSGGGLGDDWMRNASSAVTAAGPASGPMDGAAQPSPSTHTTGRVAVPLVSFSLTAVHALLDGRCLGASMPADVMVGDVAKAHRRDGNHCCCFCCCREVLLLRRLCHARQGHASISTGEGRLGQSAPAAASGLAKGLATSATDANGGKVLCDEHLLLRALHSLLASSVQACPPPPAAAATATATATAAAAAPTELLVPAESARREVLLRSEIHALEAASEAGRADSLRELTSMQHEVERAKARMLQLEVEQLNELERCRLRAQADHEVMAARRRLEQQVEALNRARDDEERRVAAERHEAERRRQVLSEELEHAREAKAAALAKTQSERDALATWQAHMEAQLAACRARLVERTERLFQIGLRLDSEDGVATTAEEIAAELRAEREARLCAVCYQEERSTVLLPCRHAVLCAACSKQVQQASGRCPLCRVGIEDTMRIFG